MTTIIICTILTLNLLAVLLGWKHQQRKNPTQNYSRIIRSSEVIRVGHKK